MKKLFYDTLNRHLNRDFNQAAGLGSIPGWTRVTALGHNPSVDIASVPEDVWEGGGLYPFQSTGQFLEAVSTSALDTNAGGTGARSVTISGLDSSYSPISETFPLNGTSVVNLGNKYQFVNQALVLGVGSTGQNQGDITIRVAGGGATQAIIPALYGITRSSIYTVRSGFTLFIVSEVLAINRIKGANATIVLCIRPSSGLVRMPLELSVSDVVPYRHDAVYGIIIPQRTSVFHRCNSVTTNGTDVSAGFEAMLIDNTLL